MVFKTQFKFLDYIKNIITTGVKFCTHLFTDDSQVYRIIYHEVDGKDFQRDLGTLKQRSGN